MRNFTCKLDLSKNYVTSQSEWVVLSDAQREDLAEVTFGLPHQINSYPDSFIDFQV